MFGSKRVQKVLNGRGWLSAGDVAPDTSAGAEEVGRHGGYCELCNDDGSVVVEAKGKS